MVVRWVKRYPVDSLQIYFAASMELQEELIIHGFQVPASRDGKIKTPLPIIYSNFRGWVKEPEPLTDERLIPPEWYGKRVEELGWIYLGTILVQRGKRRQRRNAFRLPQEEVYVDVGFDDERRMYFKLDVKGYHLERTSIREIDPGKWNNWAMFYLDAEYLDDLLHLIQSQCGIVFAKPLNTVLESLQGGKERTYYASTEYKGLGIPVEGFSLCIGCFELALEYFKYKAEENGLDRDVVDTLKLRLEYDPNVNVGLKVGVARIVGKRSQVMFKLASNTPVKIKGVLEPVVEGKARGRLTHCNHERKEHTIAADAGLVYSALVATKPKLKVLSTS